MARNIPPQKLSPKEQVLRDLDEARALLGAHVQLASEAWNPRELLKHSLHKHAWAWALAVGVGGALIWKLATPSYRGKFDRDISGASDKKNGFIALLMQPVLGMARQAALKYGSQFLQTYLTNQFSQPAATSTAAPDASQDHV
jgi:hypothetical protein